MSPFKSSIGSYYTQSLFYETNTHHQNDLYTLKNQDWLVGDKLYPSLCSLYLQTCDPTEYEFAKTYLDSWEHWEMLLKCKWFQPYVESWRKQLELQILSRAFRNIKDTAENTASKYNYEANKLLLSLPWRDKTNKNSKGRPTKEAIRQEAERIAEDQRRLEQDAQLIGTLN